MSEPMKKTVGGWNEAWCIWAEKRIAALESLLKEREGKKHDAGCAALYPSGNCICGHDAVSKYFAEKSDE